MDLQCKFLIYLDKRSFLDEMKSYCEKFKQYDLQENANKFPPLRFLLEIDVMDLQNMFPEVADLLLKEPLKLQKICSDILYACLQATGEDIVDIVQPAQVTVLVRVKCLPKPLVTPNTKTYSGLVTFEGILLAVSKPEVFVYHTVWSCPEECIGSEVILPFIPKVPRKCYVCRSILYETGGMRRCGEQVKATFKIDNSISCRDFKIVEDLIPRLSPGSKFSIHAVVTKNVTEVLSLEEILPLPAPATSPIPKDLLELFQTCDGVPWKFLYCLASCIGCNICPLNCFMHLKISLLISLTSVKANQITGSNIFHVLSAGFDTSYVGDIMTDAARLADECIFLGTSNTAIPTALVASAGGVCVMPLPLHVYNQKQTSIILAAIESGEITIDTGQTKLQSAVWAQGMDFKKVKVLNVANVFGTVCRGDLGEYADEIAEFILQRAIEPVLSNDEEKEAFRELAMYIDLVAGIEVVLDRSAETLLRNYFLSARRERPRCVSVNSMNALIATCETSARLCRRSVASIDDAVLAVWLHVSGGPEPRVAPEEYLQTPSDVKRLNKMMISFKEWLEHFTGTALTY